MADRKKRRGDRKDGYLVRETDPLHAISPYILPNRTDNEAVLTETVDMTNVVAYIEGRNADSPEFRYTSPSSVRRLQKPSPSDRK